ncbi:ankyrin repeat domain-containing protein [Chloropicon primus]|nr:ankyrin repeat domain-containing protein [Chloropicon primus]
MAPPQTTVLHQAARDNNVSKMRSVLYLFKTKRPTIDAKDNVGRTPLIEAARYGCYDAVKYLLDNGASSRVQTNTTGSTCLHQAVKHRHSDVVKLLLAYGANPNVKNFDGVNCFELAQKNHFDDILYLLQNPDATQVAKNRDYVPPLVSGLD